MMPIAFVFGFAIVAFCVGAPAVAAADCTSVQAQCAVEAGRRCDAQTGHWCYGRSRTGEACGGSPAAFRTCMARTVCRFMGHRRRRRWKRRGHRPTRANAPASRRNAPWRTAAAAMPRPATGVMATRLATVAIAAAARTPAWNFMPACRASLARTNRDGLFARRVGDAGPCRDRRQHGDDGGEGDVRGERAGDGREHADADHRQ